MYTIMLHVGLRGAGKSDLYTLFSSIKQHNVPEDIRRKIADHYAKPPDEVINDPAITDEDRSIIEKVAAKFFALDAEEATIWFAYHLHAQNLTNYTDPERVRRLRALNDVVEMEEFVDKLYPHLNDLRALIT